MKFLEDSENQHWDNYVNQHPRGHIFHLTKWKQVLQESFNFSPLYLYYQNQEGGISGILPLMKVKSLITGRRIISLPFSFICGPITDSADITVSLISEAREFLQSEDCSYIEIKSDHEFSPIDTHYRILDDHYCHYLLPIKGNADDIFRSLHKNMVQRAISKAEREGVEIIQDKSTESLKIFYRLNCLTHRKHGIPPPPFKFYQQMFDTFETEDRLRLFLAKINQLYIAAGIFATHGDTIYYLYGASDERYLKHRANQLVLWNLIKWGIENNFSYFEMGRASVDNKGLRDYKKRWNSTEHQLYYYYFPEIRGIGAVDRNKLKVRLLKSVWENLPISLIRKSSILYKHLA
jgi:hypothetical protein